MRLMRYLFLQLAPAALVANFVINAFFAAVLYPAEVPRTGPGSVANDCYAAAFLIGAVTWLTVSAGARREALSGRVPGGGNKWLAWLPRHPFLMAFAWGCLFVVAIAVPFVSAFARPTMDVMSHSDFVWLKGAFAAWTGVIAALGCADLTIAAEPKVEWSPPAEATLAYPFQYFDKGALAVTANDRGCSGTPTWQLVVDGQLNPDHVRTALTHLAALYPSLATKVRSLDGVPPWATRFRYVVDPSFDAGEIFQVLDLRDHPESLPQVAQEVLDRPLDRFSRYPWSLTQVLLPDHCRLLFRQHHGIADGRAFIGLLGDFAAFVEAARGGPAADVTPIGRRSELEALQQTAIQRVIDTVMGCAGVIASEIRDRTSPRSVLIQNRSNDYSGENGTVHWVVPEAMLDRWNEARKQLGVSLNSYLTGALCVATNRWQGTPPKRTRINLMVETRPRDGSFVSFANHLARMSLDVQLDHLPDIATAAKVVQTEAEKQRLARAPIRQLMAETFVTYAMPLADMQRIVFESKRPSINLDFSNLIPLAFPTLEGQGWRVREVLITTPVTPRVGLTLTVIRYNGMVCFNFNYKSTAVTREQTEAFAKEFASVLA